MYTPIYKIPFASVNDLEYEVQILTEQPTTTPVILDGSRSAFTVEYNSDDFLYTPTRLSGATLRILAHDHLDELFSTQYQKYKVNLLRGSEILWTGFATPEVYSQEDNGGDFELEIECVSAMAILGYIEFKHDKENISFLDLIKKCVSESKGDFRAVYIPQVYKEQLSSIYISTANFVDEHEKRDSLLDCLKEVCKFLNWTLFEFEGIVYFVDVDYIKARKTAYTDLSSGNTVNLSSSVDLSGLSSEGNDNTYSILGGYNEITVLDSDYELQSSHIYPDISLDEKIDSSEVKAGADGKEGNDCTYKTHWYMSENFLLRSYSHLGPSWEQSQILHKDYAGSQIVNFTSYKNEEKPTSLNWEKMFEVKMWDHGNCLDGHDKLIINEADKVLKGQISSYLKPLITNKPVAGSIAFPDDGYLGINLSVCLVPPLGDPTFRGIPIELNHKNDSVEKVLEDAFNFDIVNDSNYKDLYFVPAQIKIGDKYFNGTGWVPQQTFCKIPLDVDKKTHLEAKWIGVKNTNSFELGVSDLGDCYAIKLDSGLYGKLEITLYVPCIVTRSKEYIYIKDVKVESARVNLSDKGEERQDTKYTNVANGDYINAMDDIEFRITSKNDSNVCFSKAIMDNTWLDTLGNNIDDSQAKPEEMLIKRIINQYSEPKLKMIREVEPPILPYSIITDRYSQGKEFVFTGGALDYERNKLKCNVIEVK